MGNIIRRGLMQLPTGGGGGGGLDDYVTDGLVLWLDGIYNTSSGHNSSASVWEDLSGNGYGYILDSLNTWGESYLQTNGRGGQKQQQFSTDDYNAIKTVGTFEYVLSPDSLSGYGCILPINNVHGLTYKKNSDLAFNRSGSSLAMLLGVHYYNSLLWRDGVLQPNTLVTDSWGNYRNELFCYTGPNSYPYSGKVYAMRVYKRALTEAELTQNWLADKARFGIS